MSAKESSRKRSRPVQKRSIFDKKGVKFGLGLVIIIIIVAISWFILISSNSAPEATDDYPVIEKNSANYQINVLSNDIDDDGDSLIIVDVTTPSHGTASINENYIDYTPSAEFSGVDTIEYTISDGKGASATATIHVIVSNGNPIALFDTTMGIFAIELYENKLPITVGNFVKLVNDGFYDGMIFYRISDDFMIQAGRYFPDGSESQSPYGTIEFETNDDVRHVDGAISMASTAPGVGGSAEFFICDGEQSFLDGSYAAFGAVIEGMDVVRDIASQPQDNSNPAGGGVPLEDIIINSINIE